MFRLTGKAKRRLGSWVGVVGSEKVVQSGSVAKVPDDSHCPRRDRQDAGEASSTGGRRWGREVGVAYSGRSDIHIAMIAGSRFLV